jgi:hypothetical protein
VYLLDRKLNRRFLFLCNFVYRQQSGIEIKKMVCFNQNVSFPFKMDLVKRDHDTKSTF